MPTATVAYGRQLGLRRETRSWGIDNRVMVRAPPPRGSEYSRRALAYGKALEIFVSTSSTGADPAHPAA